MEIISIRQIPAQQANMELLLLADEEEHLPTYRDRAEAYVLEMDDELAAQALVTDEGDRCELQNLAVMPEYQRLGLGKMLLAWVTDAYRGRCKKMTVSTSPANVPFYEACGFTVAFWEKDYFLKAYAKPVIENGEQLRDRCVLEKKIG